MREVWQRQSATVREVLDALNQRGGKHRAYTTVMTIMSRLHRKGLLDRASQDGTYVYVPRLSREEYARLRAEAGVDALVREFGDEALVHFAKRMGSLDPERQERLRRLAGSE
jgi:predicted transcriptional regulator